MTIYFYFLNYLSNAFCILVPTFPYLFIDICTIVMPTFGYIDQIRLIITTGSEEYYNETTALIMIAAGGIKSFFWLFEHYGIPLLGQNVTLCLIGIIHTFIYFYYKNCNNKNKINPSNNTSLCMFTNPKRLLFPKQASNFIEYMISIGFYSAILLTFFLILCLAISKQAAVNIYAVLGSSIDSIVSVPLFKRVVIDKDVKTVTWILPAQYFVSDIMRFGVCFVNHSPLSFYFGSALQTCIDISTGLVFIFHKYVKNSSATASDYETEEESNEVMRLDAL